jgi:hypothetical protein
MPLWPQSFADNLGKPFCLRSPLLTCHLSLLHIRIKAYSAVDMTIQKPALFLPNVYCVRTNYYTTLFERQRGRTTSREIQVLRYEAKDKPS